MNLNSSPDAISEFLKQISPELRVWRFILDAFGDDIWKIPISAYVVKNAKFSENGEIRMTKKAKHTCVYLMFNVARYLYAKGFGKNLISGRTIKKEMQYATTLIEKGEIYEPEINLTPEFEKLLDQPIPPRFRKGFCALVDFNTCFEVRVERFIKHEKKLPHPILETAVVSHLLSTKWVELDCPELDDCDFWTTERIKNAKYTLGNLILVEPDKHTNKMNQILEGTTLPLLHDEHRTANFLGSEVWRLRFKKTDWTGWCYSKYITRQAWAKKTLLSFFEGFGVLYQPD